MFEIGMIGTGIIAPVHFRAIKEGSDFRLGAISEINEEKAKKASEEQGVPYYLDYKEMCEKEGLDAVIINLPHFLHCEATIFCLERGINVLCEKPMANTVEECEKMILASQKSGAKLVIGHSRRFNPALQGVGNVEAFREPFTVLKRNGVKKMYEACDMDKTVNENVANGVKKLNNLIKDFKFLSKSMRWKWDKDNPKEIKGIDDMLLNKKKRNM